MAQPHGRTDAPFATHPLLFTPGCGLATSCRVYRLASVPGSVLVTCFSPPFLPRGYVAPPLNSALPQNIVYTLTDYGVPEDNILGIRYGLRGFYERDAKPINLTCKYVDGIHLKGGTMLVRTAIRCCMGCASCSRWNPQGNAKSVTLLAGMGIEAKGQFQVIV